MVPVSKRMIAIADMVSPGLSVADIGCDHGFVDIYLVTKKKTPYAIAMDVNNGPLMRAKEHISRYGLDEFIGTRLSDGALELNKGEVEAAIIAGMGGRLTIKIIEESLEIFKGLREMVLSPHSDVPQVREYLSRTGFEILDEDMVFDEEKYYSIMKCAYCGTKKELTLAEYSYGPVLLKKKHPVLNEYLQMRKVKLEEIEATLRKSLEESSGKSLEKNGVNFSDEKREAIQERISEITTENNTIEGLLLSM